MIKTIYIRVSHFDTINRANKRTKGYNDFNTLIKVINYNNEMKKLLRLNQCIKAFNKKTFKYAKTIIDSIKVD